MYGKESGMDNTQAVIVRGQYNASKVVDVAEMTFGDKTVDLGNALNQIVDLQDALIFLSKLDVLGDLMKKQKIFAENAVVYCRLHAETILKIAQLGGLGELPRGLTRKAADWLNHMGKSDLEWAFDEMAQGLSVEQLYKREVADKEKEAKRGNQLKQIRDTLLDQCEHDGFVDLTHYKDEVAKLVDDLPTQLDVIDGTRGALRKMGAVGVEPRSDLYVMPTSDNKVWLQRAIVTRIKSVVQDILSIKTLVKATGVKIPYSEAYQEAQQLWDNRMPYFERGMKGTAYASLKGSQSYVAFLMCSLAELGLFEDEEEFYNDLSFAMSGFIDEESTYMAPKSLTYRIMRKQWRELQNKAVATGRISEAETAKNMEEDNGQREDAQSSL